jgi:hypothetical protein
MHISSYLRNRIIFAGSSRAGSWPRADVPSQVLGRPCPAGVSAAARRGAPVPPPAGFTAMPLRLPPSPMGGFAPPPPPPQDPPPRVCRGAAGRALGGPWGGNRQPVGVGARSQLPWCMGWAGRRRNGQSATFGAWCYPGLRSKDVLETGNWKSKSKPKTRKRKPPVVVVGVVVALGLLSPVLYKCPGTEARSNNQVWTMGQEPKRIDLELRTNCYLDQRRAVDCQLPASSEPEPRCPQSPLRCPPCQKRSTSN